MCFPVYLGLVCDPNEGPFSTRWRQLPGRRGDRKLLIRTGSKECFERERLSERQKKKLNFPLKRWDSIIPEKSLLRYIQLLTFMLERVPQRLECSTEKIAFGQALRLTTSFFVWKANKIFSAVERRGRKRTLAYVSSRNQNK